MKNKIIIWLALSLIFSFMFYQETIGINILIFSICLILSVHLHYKPKITLTLAFTEVFILVSGFSCFFIGHPTGLIMNIIGLITLRYLAVKNSSFLVAIGQGLHSTTVGSLVKISLIFHSRDNNHQNKRYRFGQKVLYLMIPLLLTALFIILYSIANEAFHRFVTSFSFDISWGLIFFTSLGAYLVFGFLYGVTDNSLEHWESSVPDITPRRNRNFTPSQRPFFKFKIEHLSGIILFSLLNLVILTVVITEIVSLSGNLPISDNGGYSKNVHDGIAALIVSILVAISLIMYYFRGNLNYYSKNRNIKILAISWIALNLILVLCTFYRTLDYIYAFDLTYKRIGVLVYLLLTVVGLCITISKIIWRKSNWFLIKKNLWLFFIVLNVYSLFNWDAIITRYNIKRSDTPDLSYLTKLSNKNLDLLLTNSSLHTEDFDGNTSLPAVITENLIDFLKSHDKVDWPSFNLVDSRIQNLIDNSNDNGIFQSVIIDYATFEDLEALSRIDNIQHITARSLNYQNIEYFQQFKHLKTLTIVENGRTSYNLTGVKLPGVEIKLINTDEGFIYKSR